MDASPRQRFPERIGRYELMLPIASGGTATVYLGRAHGIGGFEREVAVKVMHPHLYRHPDEPDSAGADLIEEAKLAARIRHLNVVPVLDVGEDPEGIFLVMDYVQGESLAALLRLTNASGNSCRCRSRCASCATHLRTSTPRTSFAMRRVPSSESCIATFHRRRSSSASMVLRSSPIFGIAKAADRDSRTKSGMVKGKAGYMSPEQARAQKLDRRSDVRAAGVVAWEVLAGRRLFAHSDPVAIALAIVTQRAPRVKSVVRRR